MITSLKWIRRGACASEPRRVVADSEEYKRMAERAGFELDDAKDELERAQLAAGSGTVDDGDEDGNWNDGEDGDESDSGVDSDDDDDAMDVEPADELAEYKLDDYDNEPTSAIENVNIFSNVKSVAYHADGSEDPYVTNVDDELEEEDEEALLIAPYDSVLVVATKADDIPQLEFQVLEGEPDEDDDDEDEVADTRTNLYTHHDVMLPAIAFDVEWFDYVPGAKTEFKSTAHSTDTGSFVAVAGHTSDIELWDADVIDAMFPVAVLGAPRGKDAAGNLQAKSKKVNDAYHVSSVLSLSWNASHRNFLASGSADTTVKIWDLDTLSAVRSLVPHVATPTARKGAKVCLTRWAPAAPTCLLTGGFDSSVRFFDTRSPESALRVNLTADPESAVFNHPASDSQVFVSTEDGHIVLVDLRNAASPVWTLKAHDGGSAACISLTPMGTTLASVGGKDKTVKLWNVASGKPEQRHARQLQLGQLFTCAWCPDQEGVLAVGGERGSVVLDLNMNAVITANANFGGEDGDSESDGE
ncbi:rRNA-processing protein [Blastocladiella emersonii ATCC 22665]|nr:rRNA-processing protein [Blastocladiella emersonii ATCC 22665]